MPIVFRMSPNGCSECLRSEQGEGARRVDEGAGPLLGARSPWFRPGCRFAAPPHPTASRPPSPARGPLRHSSERRFADSVAPDSAVVPGERDARGKGIQWPLNALKSRWIPFPSAPCPTGDDGSWFGRLQRQLQSLGTVGSNCAKAPQGEKGSPRSGCSSCRRASSVASDGPGSRPIDLILLSHN